MEGLLAAASVHHSSHNCCLSTSLYKDACECTRCSWLVNLGMASAQARRTKEMLSANTEAPFIVEELLDGQDFRSSIKRQQLEDLAGDFFQRAATPLHRLLQRNGLAPMDVHAVELLGGGSRIPKLQAELGRVLNGRVLDKYVGSGAST